MPQRYQSGITHKCLVIFYHHERNYSHPRPDIKKISFDYTKETNFSKKQIFFSPLDDIKKISRTDLYVGGNGWCEWVFFSFFGYFPFFLS